MKKLLVFFVSFLALFAVVGCTTQSSQAVDKLGSTDEVYGFEALTSINLLDSMVPSEAAPIKANTFTYAYAKLGYEEVITEEEINEINKYLGIMEQMLSDDKPITIVDETSDRPEYMNKMVISTKDLNLNVHTYVLYYNEVALADTELADTEVVEEDEDNKPEEQNEIETSLEGIMVVGENEYTVSGKKEIENDELKVQFTSKIDDNNWVKVTQKTENEESKFEYTISENAVVSKTKMKFEEEDNETKLKLQLEQGEINSEYEFKMEEEDGKKIIKIEIQNDTTNLEAKVYVVVDPVTGETTYEYKIKDSKKSFKRNRGIDDDDDDEEDEEEEDNEELDNL